MLGDPLRRPGQRTAHRLIAEPGDLQGLAVAHGGQPWQDTTVFETVVLGVGGADFYNKSLVKLDQAALTGPTMIKAFDTLAKADESVTKLTHFELHYRTKGDFEIMVYKKVSGGVEAAVEGGFFDRTRLFMTLDDFTKLRWFIAQAKERLDEIGR